MSVCGTDVLPVFTIVSDEEKNGCLVSPCKTDRVQETALSALQGNVAVLTLDLLL